MKIAIIVLIFASIFSFSLLATEEECKARKSCDYLKPWSEVKELVVSFTEPDKKPKSKIRYHISNLETIVKVESGKETAFEMVEMGGIANLYKSEKINAGTDCLKELLDTPSVFESYAKRTLYMLGRANYGGPSAVQKREEIEMEVKEKDEMLVVNPGTYIPLPSSWKLKGIIEKKNDNLWLFDLIQNSNEGALRIKGSWSSDIKLNAYPDSESVKDWKICYWQNAKEYIEETNIKPITFGDIRMIRDKIYKSDSKN